MISRRLTKDERALEGLPLQLMIIALVLSIGLPIVYNSISGYDSSRMMQEMEEQAVSISEKARQVYLYGEGNSDVIEIELQDGIFHSVEFFELDNESVVGQIRLAITGGSEDRHLMPDFPLFLEEAPLRLDEGEHRLSVECRSGNRADMDEEGLYVEITKV